jgi:glycosyltransferase involved in cell wall biosynthesis
VTAETPRIVALAVTFERPEVFSSTLKAFAAQSLQASRLVVVDNSPAGTARAVVESVGGTILVPGRNLGPGGGYQLGLDHVLSLSGIPDTAWVMFIDDDDPPRCRDEVRSLLEFGEACARLKKVGGVGRAGGRINGQGRLQRVPDGELKGAVPVDYIGSGQLPFYRVGALRRLRFDLTPLFFGFEDLDLGLALKAAGYPLLVPGEAWLAERKRLGVFGLSARDARRAWTAPPWRRYYSARNLVDICRRRMGGGAAVVTTVAEVAAGARVATRTRDLSHFRAAVQGVADAWTGHLGMTVPPTRKDIA